VKIHIGNLSSQVTANDLSILFAAYGKVELAEVVKDPETGASQGVGFVLMPSRPEASAAITALHGRSLKGHKLTVKEAPPRAPQKPRRGRHRKDDRTSLA